MPAGYDAEVAELFRDLRAASGLTESELAAQLATRIEVVQALEHGALYALPPWPETCRVVSTYGTMLNLDVRPLLQRIYAQLDAGVVELSPKAPPDVPVMPPAEPTRDHQQPPRAPQPQQRAAPQGAPQRQAGPPQQPPRPPQGTPQAGAPQRQQAPQGQQARPPQPQMPRGQPMPPPYQPQGAQPPQAPWPQPQAAQPAQSFPAMPPQPTQAPQPAPRQAVLPAAPKPAPVTPLAEPTLQASLKEASKAGRPARKGWFKAPLLKWGVIALVASALLFGLWTWVAKPRLLGASGPTAQSPAVTNDPNDPRSRKADRLPGPS